MRKCECQTPSDGGGKRKADARSAFAERAKKRADKAAASSASGPA